MQKLGHPYSHPSVAAAPIKRHIRRVVEKTIVMLQFIQIQNHLLRGTLDILWIAGNVVSLRLHNGYHIHIVYPETRLPGISLSCHSRSSSFALAGSVHWESA